MFYLDHESDKALTVKTETGAMRVSDIMQPLENSDILLAVHYMPKMSPETGLEWGGGCCLWQPFKWCPAGHHDDPTFLLSFSERGCLTKHGDKWSIMTFDGAFKTVPFDLLEGHEARIAAVTLVNWESMVGSVSETDLAKLEAMGVQAGVLQDTLKRLRETIKEIH